GAGLVDSYECDDQQRAFERIQDISKRQLVILLSSDAALFKRIESEIGSFPRASIIWRMAEPPGEWIESETPTFRCETSNIRKVWAQIRELLDQQKIPISENSRISVRRDQNQNTIDCGVTTPLTERIPVMLNATFHPGWQREDGGAIYAVTPFNMLTFLDRPTRLTYGRSLVEKLGVVFSIVTFILLFLWASFAKSIGMLKHIRRSHDRMISSREAR